MNTSWPLIVLLLIAAASNTRADDWPAFRGPLGNGKSAEETAPVHWGPGQNVRWMARLPGPGNGSPIVSRGRVFVTCAEDPKGLRRSLYCFDRQDGDLRWVRTVTYPREMPTHKTNGYCGSTPAADGQRVVVWHGSAGLYCYDLEGNELWVRELGEFRHMWGYATSPVIDDDRVIMHCGPGTQVFLAALDSASGAILWTNHEPVEGTGERREDGNYLGSWTTPVIVPVDGRNQIICTMPTRVVAYDSGNGQILWTCDGIRGPRGSLAYSSPIIANDVCIAIGGFNGPGLGLRLGGSGDVTRTHVLWQREKNPQNIGSGVFVDGYVYLPHAGPGTIECLDPKTGQTVWTDRAAGANHWASLIYVAGHCYATNQKGTTVVFEPSPDGFRHVATNRLGESSNATPAISDGEVFIRTDQHLYCLAEE